MNNRTRKIFITGIGTDIGKTIIAAILVEAMKADYWKPIQAGNLDDSDSLKLRSLISNQKSIVHPEKYLLSKPLSPHAAAHLDGIAIELEGIRVPETDNVLIIEGAGGIMVPLNEKDLVVDLIAYLGAEVILVSQNYLGSINHTLLTCEVLRNRKIPVLGIVFNGDSVPASEDFILKYTGLKCLGRVSTMQVINKESVREAGKLFVGLVN